MSVGLIVAVARNGIIGNQGKLPWRLPGDLKRFKRATVGTSVVMGRETYLSIGKPLPERTNIVLTTRTDFAPEGVLIAHSLEEALQLAREHRSSTMILGGAKVYEQALPIVDRVLLTVVDCKPEGDAHFPRFSPSDWHVEKREHFPADEVNPFACEWLELVRLPSSSSTPGPFSLEGEGEHEADGRSDIAALLSG